MGDARDRLTPAEAYELWAPAYREETAVSALESRVVQTLLPPLTERRLLDIGCGSARRVRAISDLPALAIGLDLVPAMLRAAGSDASSPLVAGDVRNLPFAEWIFDVLWCRLVLGHVPDLQMPYREMARVSKSPCTLIVTDFHPRAAAAGHSRSFRDVAGRLHEIEHHIHEARDHVDAAARSGWKLVSRVDAPAGMPERPFYEKAGRVRQFEEEADLPLVLALSFSR